jgi:hypothetical protein
MMRRDLRANVDTQVRELAARGYLIPAGAALVVHESTGRLIGYIPADEQRAAALEAASEGLEVRELGADGSERHIVEAYASGGAS